MTEPTTTDLLKAILGLGQRMEDRFTTIEAGQAELKADVEQIKHTIAANHFRTGGRIDQVANMLAEHMAAGHKSAAE